jgi:predicted nuclease with TOPRIM domain
MSEEKDILEQVESGWNACCYKSGCASEITRLRGEAEAREVEITALVESAREAQQLYVQADNEAQRLRGEVERLREALDELLFENSNKTEVERLVTRLKARDALSSAPKPEEG